MSINANIKDLGLSIDTHLCKYCAHQYGACEDIQYLYGDSEGDVEGVPNICACDGFDPRLVVHSHDNKLNQQIVKLEHRIKELESE